MKNEEQLMSSTVGQSSSVENCPEQGTDFSVKYLPYPKAIALLSARLGVTPAELAAWVYLGPDYGGLSAYRHSQENGGYRLFAYAECPNVSVLDYMAPLYSCWFREEELATFTPSERYITGKALMARWKPFIMGPRYFIAGGIRESRLVGFHPIAGLTEASSTVHISLPKLEVCLFALSEIEKIEISDFGRNLTLREKPPGHLNYDPDLQKRANQIAAELKAVSHHVVTRDQVASRVASELGENADTVKRRIRKQWK